MTPDRTEQEQPFADWPTDALKPHAERLAWQSRFCTEKHVGAPCGRLFAGQAQAARDELATRGDHHAE